MRRSVVLVVICLSLVGIGCGERLGNDAHDHRDGGMLMDTFIQEGDHEINPLSTIRCVVVGDGVAFPGGIEYTHQFRLYRVRRTYWKNGGGGERVQAERDYKALGFAPFKDGDSVDLVSLSSYEHATKHKSTAFLIFPREK